jgi:hypothetical protein
MSTQGFVEITSEMTEEVLQALVPLAYGASRAGTIVLALNDVSPKILDRHMDQAVRTHGLGVKGVHYVSADPGDTSLVQRAAQARFVIADSVELSKALSSNGVPHMGSREGLEFLGDWIARGTEGDRPAAPTAPQARSYPSRPRATPKLASL